MTRVISADRPAVGTGIAFQGYLRINYISGRRLDPAETGRNSEGAVDRMARQWPGRIERRNRPPKT
jgi:hypothetical protein